MSSGMVGAVIIEGDFADVPQIARAREHLMVLTQVVFDAYGMVEDFETLFPETATRFLAINGQRRPMIEMRPGEVQRWRYPRSTRTTCCWIWTSTSCTSSPMMASNSPPCRR